MGHDSAIRRVRVQLNSWGTTHAIARDLGNQVSARLSRFRGVVGDATVLDVLLDNDFMTYDSDTNTRRVIQDYTLYINE